MSVTIRVYEKDTAHEAHELTTTTKDADLFIEQIETALEKGHNIVSMVHTTNICALIEYTIIRNIRVDQIIRVEREEN